MASMDKGSARHHRAVGAVPNPRELTLDLSTAARPTAWARAVARYKNNVWLPVVGKAAAILCGMIALAAIGASSIARGSGAAAPSALPAASFVAGSFVPFLPSAALSHPASDAGVEGDAASTPEPAPSSPGLTADGKVILNQAGIAELRKLPGVGAKRAQAILDLRQKLGGRFRKLSDVLRVKGIGPRSLAKWKELMVLDAPQPAK